MLNIFQGGARSIARSSPSEEITVLAGTRAPRAPFAASHGLRRGCVRRRCVAVAAVAASPSPPSLRAVAASPLPSPSPSPSNASSPGTSVTRSTLRALIFFPSRLTWSIIVLFPSPLVHTQLWLHNFFNESIKQLWLTAVEAIMVWLLKKLSQI